MMQKYTHVHTHTHTLRTEQKLGFHLLFLTSQTNVQILSEAEVHGASPRADMAPWKVSAWSVQICFEKLKKKCFGGWTSLKRLKIWRLLCEVVAEFCTAIDLPDIDSGFSLQLHDICSSWACNSLQSKKRRNKRKFSSVNSNCNVSFCSWWCCSFNNGTMGKNSIWSFVRRGKLDISTTFPASTSEFSPSMCFCWQNLELHKQIKVQKQQPAIKNLLFSTCFE